MIQEKQSELDWVPFSRRGVFDGACTCDKGLAGVMAVAGAVGGVAGSVYREAGREGQDVG